MIKNFEKYEWAIKAFKSIIILVRVLKKTVFPLSMLLGIFIDQNLFYLSLFLLIFILEYKTFKSYLIYVPLIIYFFKVSFSLFDSKYYWSKLSHGYNAYFIDFKSSIRQMKCNYLNNKYDGNAFIDAKECPMFQGYGPLFNNLRLNYVNTDTVANVSAVLFFMLILFAYIKILNLQIIDNKTQFFLFMSPSFNLLINQQNMDLVVFIIFLYAILFIKNNLALMIGIFVLALFKIHPIFALFGFLIFSIKNLSTKIICINISMIISSAYLIFLENITPLLPTGPHNATGLLSISQYIWITIFDRSYGYRIVVLIFCTLSVLILLISQKFKFTLITFDSSIDYSLIIWTFGILLLANYDYRNMVLILYLIKFSKYLNIFEKNIFLSYLFLSPFQASLDGILLNILAVSKGILMILILSHLTKNILKILKDIIYPHLNSNNKL